MYGAILDIQAIVIVLGTVGLDMGVVRVVRGLSQ